MQVFRREEQAPHDRHAEREQHQHGEHLQKEAGEIDLVRVRNGEERKQPAHQAPVEAERINDKAPKDKEMGQANAPFVEDARLPEHVAHGVQNPPDRVVEAVFVASLPQ